jgi:hypothetical protein
LLRPRPMVALSAPASHVSTLCPAVSDISCCGNSCPADFDKSGSVNGSDLGELLLAWGECKGASDCAPDLTGDSQVDGQDLGELLLAWGECRQ